MPLRATHSPLTSSSAGSCCATVAAALVCSSFPAIYFMPSKVDLAPTIDSYPFVGVKIYNSNDNKNQRYLMLDAASAGLVSANIGFCGTDYALDGDSTVSTFCPTFNSLTVAEAFIWDTSVGMKGDETAKLNITFSLNEYPFSSTCGETTAFQLASTEALEKEEFNTTTGLRHFETSTSFYKGIQKIAESFNWLFNPTS
jgi:hypothetical protein